MTKPKTKYSDAELIDNLRNDFLNAQSAESFDRTEALDDLRFVAGEQWPSAIMQSRLFEQRPTLTVNRLNTYVRQVVNSGRKNKPENNIDPIGSGADIESAQMLEGIIRHIEANSDADLAYDYGLESAARIGWGYWRVLTKYVNERSFDQEICIKMVRNAMTIYLDPRHQHPDGSDARFGVVYEDMPKKEYQVKYKKTDAEMDAANTGFMGWGDNRRYWFNKDTIRIAEYFWIEDSEDTLCQYADGTTALMSEKVERTPEEERQNPETNRRKTIVPRVFWAKCTGEEILEGPQLWGGKYIPIVKITGEEVDIEGLVRRWGIVRMAKDPQRQYNYLASAEVEMVALAPKAPFIGAKGQFKGQEKNWAQANTKSFAYLEYTPVTNGGQLAPPPQRNPFAGIPEGIAALRDKAASDLQFTTGQNGTSMGVDNNDLSGKAVLLRKQSADDSNFHYMDNLGRSMRHTARILLDLIPKYYDTARIIRIVNPDGSSDMLGLNGAQGDEKVKNLMLMSLEPEQYDVRMGTGPSYNTKRQEKAEALMNIVLGAPQVLSVVGDLMFGSMDWDGSQELAERFKKLLPPELQDEDPNNPNLPPQVKAMLDAAQNKIMQDQNLLGAMQKQIADLTQTNNKLVVQNASKFADIASKERIAYKDMETSILETLAKLGVDTSKHALTHELDTLHRNEDRVNANIIGSDGDGKVPESPSPNPTTPVTTPSIDQPTPAGI